MAKPILVDDRPPVRRRRVSLRLLLALTFGSLVAVAVGAVLAISIIAGLENTFSLLSRQANRAVTDLENSLRDEGELVNRAVAGFATLHGGRRLELGDGNGVRIALDTILESTPAVEALVVFDSNGAARLARLRQPSGLVVDMPQDLLADIAANIQKAAPVAPTVTEVRWSGPFSLGPATFNVVARNLVRDGGTDGQVVALVGQWAINRVTAKLGRDGATTVFMLTRDGKQVFAHSRLPEQFRGKSAIALSEFPDEVLRRFPDAQQVAEISSDTVRAAHASGDARKSGHVFLTKEVSLFGAEPFILGAYFSGAELGQEFRRTFMAFAAGVVGLLLAVIAAVILGKRISSPMSRIAGNAVAFSDFRLGDISELPRSRVREIDDQVVAMNTLGAMMAEFTRYVPRELVARLLHSGAEAKRRWSAN
jgi:adenylate cyclase